MELINYKNFCSWCAIGDEPEIMKSILNDKKRLENNLIVCNGISDEVALNALRKDSEHLAERIIRNICRQNMLARKKELAFLRKKLDVQNFEETKQLLSELNVAIYKVYENKDEYIEEEAMPQIIGESGSIGNDTEEKI